MKVTLDLGRCDDAFLLKALESYRALAQEHKSNGSYGLHNHCVQMSLAITVELNVRDMERLSVNEGQISIDSF